MDLINFDDALNNLDFLVNEKIKMLEKNYVKFLDTTMAAILNDNPFRRGHYMHIAGLSDCGKTHFVANLIAENKDLSAIYISSKQDDCLKIGQFENAHLFFNNTFENIIEYLNEIPKGLVDIVVIDGINNMCCKEESKGSFKIGSTQRKEFESFLRQLRSQFARLDSVGIIVNGINKMNNKPKYQYIIDETSDLSFIIEKETSTSTYNKININITKSRYNLDSFDAYINLMR